MKDKALTAAHIRVSRENRLRKISLEIYNDLFPVYDDTKESERISLARIQHILESHFLRETLEEK